MSQIIESVVENILRQDATNLARQINELVKQQNTNYSWQQDNTLEEFIKALKPHIDELKQCDSNENDWKSDVFLKIINTVNYQVVTKITEEESKMPTGIELAVSTKLLIAASVLSIVGIALYAYYSKNNKDDNNIKQETDKKHNNGVLQNTKSTQSYQQYQLLLVIEANRLEQSLKEDTYISKSEAEKIISNAMFAYCFAENDADGQTVLEAVDCLDEDKDINYESEDKVFLQISLSAKSEIAEGKRDKLGIREAMNPNQRVEIKTPRKLKTTRSIKAFYSI